MTMGVDQGLIKNVSLFPRRDKILGTSLDEQENIVSKMPKFEKLITSQNPKKSNSPIYLPS